MILGGCSVWVAVKAAALVVSATVMGVVVLVVSATVMAVVVLVVSATVMAVLATVVSMVASAATMGPERRRPFAALVLVLSQNDGGQTAVLDNKMTYR
jgi:hypothetical protein